MVCISMPSMHTFAQLCCYEAIDVTFKCHFSPCWHFRPSNSSLSFTDAIADGEERKAVIVTSHKMVQYTRIHRSNVSAIPFLNVNNTK